MDQALIEAYHTALYEVRLPGGRRCALPLQAELPPALRQWLGGQSLCALITAWNPRSRPACAADNRAAQHRLLQDLRAAGLRWLPGVGRSAGKPPRWREASLLVAAPEVELIDILALRHAQNAVVLAHRQGHSRLRIYSPHDDRFD